MEYESSYYSTYGWHPLSVEAALATLQHIRKNWQRLEKNIAEMSAYFIEWLEKIDFKSERKTRSKGLAIGIEFEDDDYGSLVASKALKRGVYVQTQEMESPSSHRFRSTTQQRRKVWIDWKSHYRTHGGVYEGVL